MQASTYAVKTSACFEAGNRRRVTAGFAEFKSSNVALNGNTSRSICMRDKTACSGLCLDAADMGMKLTRAGCGVESLFRSTAKPRSVKAQASGSSFFMIFDIGWFLSF